MPTLLRRFSWIVALLAATLAAHAQDLHIKKNILVGGYSVSSTETTIHGARERIVSQTPTGNTITLHECDLKRTVTINEQAQTYFVARDAQDEAAVKAAALAAGTQDATSGAYITETSSVTDTGERKTYYGYPARHLKAKVTVQSSQNACSQVNQNYEVDGWYADLSKDLATACQQFLPPVRQNDGCNDLVIRKRSGSAKPGYPLDETITLHNADGSTTQIGARASEIVKQPVDKELFEIPAGYTEVKSLSELNGGPKPQLAQPSANAFAQQPMQQQMQQQAMQPMQQPAPNNNANRPSAAQMMNPANAMAMQQQAMAQAQAMGMGGGGAGGNLAAMMGQGGMAQGMGGMQGMQQGGTPMAAPQQLGPKAPGKIRIGVAPPDAQVGQGNNAGGDYSTPIRNAEIALMSGPAIEIAPLESHIPMQLQAEAQQKQCDYIMFSAVTVKHNSGGGFGKFAKFGSMAASMTPMGAMAHGMGGAVAAQAAGMAASQMAQQAAMNQLAGFNGQIKNKDDVTVQYQLVATGQTAPIAQNQLQGKAKNDGEDVLTPLLTQAATDVLTKVSHK
jgi:hypothetical protein